MKVLRQPEDVESDYVGEINQLDQVDAPLTGLNIGDERLMAPKPSRNLGLSETRGFLASVIRSTRSC